MVCKYVQVIDYNSVHNRLKEVQQVYILTIGWDII